MTSGDIATWVIGAIVLIVFLIGLKRVYRNFTSGKCDSCGPGSCSSSCHCSGGCATDKKVSSKVK